MSTPPPHVPVDQVKLKYALSVSVTISVWEKCLSKGSVILVVGTGSGVPNR